MMFQMVNNENDAGGPLSLGPLRTTWTTAGQRGGPPLDHFGPPLFSPKNSYPGKRLQGWSRWSKTVWTAKTAGQRACGVEWSALVVHIGSDKKKIASDLRLRWSKNSPPLRGGGAPLESRPIPRLGGPARIPKQKYESFNALSLPEQKEISGQAALDELGSAPSPGSSRRWSGEAHQSDLHCDTCQIEAALLRRCFACDLSLCTDCWDGVWADDICGDCRDHHA